QRKTVQALRVEGLLQARGPLRAELCQRALRQPQPEPEPVGEKLAPHRSGHVAARREHLRERLARAHVGTITKQARQRRTGSWPRRTELPSNRADWSTD